MRKLLLVLAVLVVAASARADVVNVTLIGYNGGNWQWGYPYFANVQGFGVIPVLCDDYVHGGMPNDHWQANLNNLAAHNIGQLRFNNMPDGNALAALVRYEEAGWMLLQTERSPKDSWRDMNNAVWHLFDPQSPLSAFGAWWLGKAQAEANIGFPGVDFSRVDIITPLNQHDPDPNGPQEFMFLTAGSADSPASSPASTPEPASLLLLGTGIVATVCRSLRS